MTTVVPAKYRIVRDSLERSILDGEYVSGEQMPGEHSIAARFGVSYMTARRAISDLVEADLLERRAGKGTFVRRRQRRRETVDTLHIITTAYDGAMVRDFLNEALRAADEQGWHANIVRLAGGQQDPAVRAIRGGGYALVMLDAAPETSALAEAMRATDGHAVAIQFNEPFPRIPCVRYDEKQTIDIAMEHLRAHGHRDIALVMQTPNIESGREQVIRWRSLLSADFGAYEIDDRLIDFHTPRFHCPTSQAYAAIRDFLTARRTPSTAMITLGDEIAAAAVRACADAGHPSPGSVSIINIGDAPNLRMMSPAVTVVDVDFAKQINAAIAILTGEMQPNDRNGVYVEPLLRERESVQPPTSRLAAQRDCVAAHNIS
ncbi:MAG: substrate-binding domain-containing protein [Capsulimonadaceae bacterium]|nr:substrate-binding domain-containing protein [Capsulimonadaceae bacterium]